MMLIIIPVYMKNMAMHDHMMFDVCMCTKCNTVMLMRSSHRPVIKNIILYNYNNNNYTNPSLHTLHTLALNSLSIIIMIIPLSLLAV